MVGMRSERESSRVLDCKLYSAWFHSCTNLVTGETVKQASAGRGYEPMSERGADVSPVSYLLDDGTVLYVSKAGRLLAYGLLRDKEVRHGEIKEASDLCSQREEQRWFKVQRAFQEPSKISPLVQSVEFEKNIKMEVLYL